MLYFEISNSYSTITKTVKMNIITKFIDKLELNLDVFNKFVSKDKFFSATHEGFFNHKIESSIGVINLTCRDKLLPYILILALYNSTVVLLKNSSEIIDIFNSIISKHIDNEPLVYIGFKEKYRTVDINNIQLTSTIAESSNFQSDFKNITSYIDLFSHLIIDYNDFIIHNDFLKNYIKFANLNFIGCDISSSIVEKSDGNCKIMVTGSLFESINYIYQNSSLVFDYLMCNNDEYIAYFIKKIYSKNISINRLDTNYYDVYNHIFRYEKNIVI